MGGPLPAPGALDLAGDGAPKGPPARKRVPERSEKDLLRLLIQHSKALNDWQRDVLSVAGEESLYFVPQMQMKGSVGTE